MLDNLLDDLRVGGVPGVPDSTGRELCAAWVRGKWLVRAPGGDEGEVYSLTSAAQTALNLIASLGRDRSTLSEHRIATIVDAARRFNAGANPSRDERVRLLDEQIAQLATERDRLVQGGDLTPPRPDFMLEGYAELIALVSALPSDFKRVEEAFEGIRRQILESFRAEDQPAGAVIDSYLLRADELMSATAEGRAFEGAFALLRNEDLLLQLRQDLDALLDHPMAEEILSPGDRRELRSTLAFVTGGIKDVLTRRSRATKAIQDYIRTHDAARDRELDTTLRQLDHALAGWLERTGPRTKVPMTLLPDEPELTYLPRRFHDPDSQGPPPPLATPAADSDDADSLADMLAWGGPSLASLRRLLTTAADSSDQTATAASLFNALEPEERRPVEVFGLLHVADDLDVVDEADSADDDHFHTIRPDGTTRTLSAPRLHVRRPRPPEEQP